MERDGVSWNLKNSSGENLVLENYHPSDASSLNSLYFFPLPVFINFPLGFSFHQIQRITNKRKALESWGSTIMKLLSQINLHDEYFIFHWRPSLRFVYFEEFSWQERRRLKKLFTFVTLFYERYSLGCLSVLFLSPHLPLSLEHFQSFRRSILLNILPNIFKFPHLIYRKKTRGSRHPILKQLLLWTS